jgi:hypothetical protein
MKGNHYLNLLMGKVKVLKPASFLNIKNIWAVIQAKKRSIGGFKTDSHIYEQIVWRRTQVMEKSPECWKQGYCRVCGCEILGKTMENRSCAAPDIGEKPCYPEMMKKEEWQKFKIDNNIKLFD